MLKFAFVLFLGALSASVSPGAFAEGVQITGDALLTAISGKRFTGTSSRGNDWEASYAQDGTYQVRLLNKSWSDYGTWEIKGDQLCTERSKKGYGCATMWRTSDNEIEWVDGRGQTTKASGPK